MVPVWAGAQGARGVERDGRHRGVVGQPQAHGEKHQTSFAVLKCRLGAMGRTLGAGQRMCSIHMHRCVFLPLKAVAPSSSQHVLKIDRDGLTA